MSFAVYKLFSPCPPCDHRLLNRAGKVWNLREAQDFVLLLFTISLFLRLWFIFHFFPYAYPIAFILKFEMNPAFKTTIISFIGFISFWIVKKDISFAWHSYWVKITVPILFRYIFAWKHCYLLFKDKGVRIFCHLKNLSKSLLF